MGDGVSRPRAFRFGVEMMGPFDGLTWAESARELESLGYSTLFVPDHLDEGYGPILREAGLSPDVPDEALLVPKGPELDLEPVESTR